MAPQVLHRVISGSPYSSAAASRSAITSTPAILHNHRRHRVKHADYPAVIPISPSSSPSSSSSSPSVRGTYVTGLTRADMYRLDLFEGDEYARQTVQPRLLTTEGDPATGHGNVEGELVSAQTYIWIVGTHRLEDREWDFAEFVRDKLRFWAHEDPNGEFEHLEAAVGATAAATAAAATAGGDGDGKGDVGAGAQGPVVDGTGGRGVNGPIGQALRAEHGKGEEELIKSAV